jgi:hypothetical protein
LGLYPLTLTTTTSLGRGDWERRPDCLNLQSGRCLDRSINHCFLKSAIPARGSVNNSDFELMVGFRVPLSPEPRRVFRCLWVKHDAANNFAVAILHIVIIRRPLAAAAFAGGTRTN